MAKRGRKPVLDETKRREILAILSVGSSRRTAARYVGCAVTTIRNTALRDPAFAAELSRAESASEIAYLRNIQKAATQERYWRAAAWALERRNPEDFGLRRPRAITLQQVHDLLTQLAVEMVDELENPKHRKQILKQVRKMLHHAKQLAEAEERPNQSIEPGEEESTREQG